MSVMGITDMGMGVSGWCMAVFMGVPIGAIGVDPFQLLQAVLVFVMEVAVAGIVAMAVGMAQGLMVMPMAVLLPEQENNTCSHQSGGQKQVEREGLAQHRKRKDSANKGSRREDHRLSRCT